MGMSLLLFFVTLGVPLSLTTITLAHITFCISYVALVVLARLQDFDSRLVEAARDLGAALVPGLPPGHPAAAGARHPRRRHCWPSPSRSTTSSSPSSSPGPAPTTLPVQIYRMIKHSRLPMINALSTILLTVTLSWSGWVSA